MAIQTELLFWCRGRKKEENWMNEQFQVLSILPRTKILTDNINRKLKNGILCFRSSWAGHLNIFHNFNISIGSWPPDNSHQMTFARGWQWNLSVLEFFPWYNPYEKWSTILLQGEKSSFIELRPLKNTLISLCVHLEKPNIWSLPKVC